ncbi:MAG: hypothetical protein Q9225_003289 [Loekoesia sp. 1 TL-2023]
MSPAQGSYVYTGPWINWSHGPVLGATITLSQRSGSLLTAFLGIFITFAGAACWRILSFLVHQYRAKPVAQDALHHQQQVVLCNSSSPGSAAWQMTRMLWAWRKLANRPSFRVVPVILLALANLIFFGVAGVFSAEVTKAAGNETLIRSSNCGYLFPNSSLPDNSPIRQSALNSIDTDTTMAASTYSRACYGDVQDKLQCNQYAVPQVRFKTNRNATCPFESGLCLLGPTTAYQIDTDLIDTHEILGINAPKRDRVQYRRVTTCSVLHTKDHYSMVNQTDADGNTIMSVHYNFGALPELDQNYTYSYNLNMQGSYGPILANAGSSQTWIPISQLNRTDADVTLMFLAPNEVQYLLPVTDPLFTATLPGIVLPSTDGNITYYSPDYTVSVLGCTEQYQCCNPTNAKCTSLSGSDIMSREVGSIGLNGAQGATFQSLSYALVTQSIYYSVSSRGASALRASDTLSGSTFTQIGLPPTQWMTEVWSWFEVSMAKLQQLIVNYATGPSNVPEGTFLYKPSTSDETELCKRQKVRSPDGYISFSVLGIVIILVVGGLLIVINLVLDAIVGFLRRSLRWQDHKRLQWAMDEKLQLQRLAYQGVGQGTWSGAENFVPVTRRGELVKLPLAAEYHSAKPEDQPPESDVLLYPKMG